MSGEQIATTLAAVLRQIKREHGAAFALDDDEDWAGWYAKMLLPYLAGFYPFADPVWREARLRDTLLALDKTWVKHQRALGEFDPALDWAGFYAANLVLY